VFTATGTPPASNYFDGCEVSLDETSSVYFLDDIVNLLYLAIFYSKDSVDTQLNVSYRTCKRNMMLCQNSAENTKNSLSFLQRNSKMQEVR